MKKRYALPSGSSGFSLIELMVVIGVAGIITSIMIATFFKAETRESEVYNAAREFGAYAQKYRMQGINENICYVFSFTVSTTLPATNQYQIFKNDACDGSIASPSTLEKTVNLSDYKFEVMFGNLGGGVCSSLGVSVCSLSFYFKPRGFLNQSVDVSIYFTTKGDYDAGNKDVQTRATIDSLTGRVDLDKYAQAPW